MAREVNISVLAQNGYSGRWLEANAIDPEPEPIDQIIRADEGKGIIVITGVRAWPYPGQDMEREPNPLGETQSLYVGPCQCCGGNGNRHRWCAVCGPKTPGVKALPKDPLKKYVKAAGMKGGIGA